MTTEEQRLYDTYANWTSLLHFWVKQQLGEPHLNAEFLPAPNWEMRIFAGPIDDGMIGQGHTVPSISRPAGGRTVPLPRPEQHPTQEQLDNAFRTLCLAAAQVLQIDVSKAKLKDKETYRGRLKNSARKKR